MLEQKDSDAIKAIIKESENEVLEEIGNTQTYLEAKIEKVEENLKELNQYY